MTRNELENEVIDQCNNIISEIECRDGQPFDGELFDALCYLDSVKDALEILNNDDYEDYTKIFKNENEYE